MDFDPISANGRSHAVVGLKAQGRRRRGQLSALAAAPIARRRNDLSPRLEIEPIAIADLKPLSRGTRRQEAAHIQEVAASIAGLGFSVPVVIGADNAIINGEISVLAARQLGLTCVPCIRMHHLSTTEQRVLRLALNRLAERGDWVLEELKIEFEELILKEAPIEITGFAAPEIDQILLGEDIAALEQGPLEPQHGATPVARRGDIFNLGPHRIICADAFACCAFVRSPWEKCVLTTESSAKIDPGWPLGPAQPRGRCAATHRTPPGLARSPVVGQSFCLTGVHLANVGWY